MIQRSLRRAQDAVCATVCTSRSCQIPKETSLSSLNVYASKCDATLPMDEKKVAVTQRFDSTQGAAGFFAASFFSSEDGGQVLSLQDKDISSVGFRALMGSADDASKKDAAFQLWYRYGDASAGMARIRVCCHGPCKDPGIDMQECAHADESAPLVCCAELLHRHLPQI